MSVLITKVWQYLWVLLAKVWPYSVCLNDKGAVILFVTILYKCNVMANVGHIVCLNDKVWSRYVCHTDKA